MNIKKSKVAVAAAIALGLVAAANSANAAVVAHQRNNVNFQFTSGTPALIPDSTFFANQGDTIVVSFSAECAVNAPAGNSSAWTDIDIQLINSAGAVVNTLSPTNTTDDAFCTSNGTLGFDGWSMNSVTTAHNFTSAGTFTIRVIGRLNGGATGAWFGDKSLVIQR